MYAPQSPARRFFGRVGSHDAALGSFALQVFFHQPAAVASAFWVDVRRYFVPSWHQHGWYKGWDIDPQLEWDRQAGPSFTRDTITGMTRFFDRFASHRNTTLVGFMHAYEQVFGLGGVLLSLCTCLTLLGLCVGSGRRRAGVVLLGIGGLAQLIGPTIGVLYMGRYAVPVAGLVSAGAAISAASVLDAYRLGRSPERARRRVLRGAVAES
jgi:hypothetical protein